jgi:HAD superfamily hydrolase (TIGR01493 family)
VINGVLFDFSGTLFHFEPDLDSQPLDRARLIETVTSPTPAEGLPPELIEGWERRDLDPELHRTVYLAALRAAHPDVPTETLVEVYELVPEPESWMPYPDTISVLRGLYTQAVPIGVVSNIPWDIRGVFQRTGTDEFIDEYVLSYAEGVMKPDPKIFRTACERIGIPPSETLMVGDNPDADGAATAIGCAFAEVARVPPAERPDALLAALATHHLGTGGASRTISG